MGDESATDTWSQKLTYVGQCGPGGHCTNNGLEESGRLVVLNNRVPGRVLQLKRAPCALGTLLSTCEASLVWLFCVWTCLD